MLYYNISVSFTYIHIFIAHQQGKSQSAASNIKIDEQRVFSTSLGKKTPQYVAALAGKFKNTY